MRNLPNWYSYEKMNCLLLCAKFFLCTPLSVSQLEYWNAAGSNALSSTENVSIEIKKKVSEYDQEIPQSHTAGQPTTP